MYDRDKDECSDINDAREHSNSKSQRRVMSDVESSVGESDGLVYNRTVDQLERLKCLITICFRCSFIRCADNMVPACLSTGGTTIRSMRAFQSGNQRQSI